MGIFSKQKKSNVISSDEDYVELGKNKAKSIIENFKENSSKYPLVENSDLFFYYFYKLKDLEYDIKDTCNSDEVGETISEMENIYYEFTKSLLSNDMKMKENAEEIRKFVKKNKKFFVLEPLYSGIDINPIYCFSYKIRYDNANNRLVFLGLNNLKQNAEYMSISPADYKLREMNEFDFGEYVDIRFSLFKTINEEQFLFDRYKKLHDMFVRDNAKSK